MKTITTENGLMFTAFEFKDFTGKTRDNILMEHYTFLSMIDQCEYDENEIIENIEINEYLFHLDGSLLPVTHYTGKHPNSGKDSIRIMGKEYFYNID